MKGLLSFFNPLQLFPSQDPPPPSLITGHAAEHRAQLRTRGGGRSRSRGGRLDYRRKGGLLCPDPALWKCEIRNIENLGRDEICGQDLLYVNHSSRSIPISFARPGKQWFVDRFPHMFGDDPEMKEVAAMHLLHLTDIFDYGRGCGPRRVWCMDRGSAHNSSLSPPPSSPLTLA